MAVVCTRISTSPGAGTGVGQSVRVNLPSRATTAVIVGGAGGIVCRKRRVSTMIAANAAAAAASMAFAEGIAFGSRITMCVLWIVLFTAFRSQATVHS